MPKARLVITAVVVENRSVAEVAAAYFVSRSWIYELVARYRTEGDAAFDPRSKRPNRAPRTTAPAVTGLILDLRTRLTSQGLDAGADTIVWHLEHHHQIRTSRATVYRLLRRANTITAEPKKKPKSSYIRFQAEQPGHVALDQRSALCQRADGLMMYAVVGKVDIDGPARALISARCERAMELDINGSWPPFVSSTSQVHARPFLSRSTRG